MTLNSTNMDSSTDSMDKAIHRLLSFLTTLICLTFAAAVLILHLIDSLLAGQWAAVHILSVCRFRSLLPILFQACEWC